MSTKYHLCIDCGAIVARRDAKRCRSCAAMGKLNSSYIDGRRKIGKKCVDCNKCNAIANGNRNYWKKYYKNLIKGGILWQLV
jgi:hypothetical protein